MTTAVDALKTVTDALSADGFLVDIQEDASTVNVTITAGPDACAECLSPRQLAEPMMERELQKTGVRRRLILQYPVDFTE